MTNEHELDTWDFDLRNQTLLHRNAAGYYEFAHKSLAEYFVAFKFAAELGSLSKVFSQTYCEADGKCCPIPIKKKNIIELAETFGIMALTDNRIHAIRGLLYEIIAENGSKQLWELINDTKTKTPEQVKYTGGNAATLLRMMGESFIGVNLANTILTSADLHDSNFTKADFQKSFMENVNLSGCNLTGANMESCDLHKGNLVHAILLNVSMRNANLTDVLLDDPKVNNFIWSLNGEYLTVATDADISIWDANTWQLISVLEQNRKRDSLVLRSETNDLFVSTSYSNTIDVWDIRNIHRPEKLNILITDEKMINNLYFSPSGKYLSASHGESGKISIWDITTGKQLTSFEAQKGWCNAALFLQNEDTMLSTGYGGDIRIWNWKMHNLEFNYVIKGAGNAYELQLTKNYDRISAVVSFPENPYDSSRSQKFFVWSFPDFRPVFSEDVILSRGRGFCISPDGSRMAYIQRKKPDLYSLILKKIEVNAGTVFLIKDYKEPLTSIKFGVDGSTLAYSCNSSIYVCDVDSESTNFGQCKEVAKIKMNCNGMIISGARGIRQKRKMETKNGLKETLLEFFEERGAVLDDEQKLFLTESRKFVREMQPSKV